MDLPERIRTEKPEINSSQILVHSFFLQGYHYLLEREFKGPKAVDGESHQPDEALQKQIDQENLERKIQLVLLLEAFDQDTPVPYADIYTADSDIDLLWDVQRHGKVQAKLSQNSTHHLMTFIEPERLVPRIHTRQVQQRMENVFRGLNVEIAATGVKVSLFTPYSHSQLDKILFTTFEQELVKKEIERKILERAIEIYGEELKKQRRMFTDGWKVNFEVEQIKSNETYSPSEKLKALFILSQVLHQKNRGIIEPKETLNIKNNEESSSHLPFGVSEPMDDPGEVVPVEFSRVEQIPMDGELVRVKVVMDLAVSAEVSLRHGRVSSYSYSGLDVKVMSASDTEIAPSSGILTRCLEEIIGLPEKKLTPHIFNPRFS